LSGKRNCVALVEGRDWRAGRAQYCAVQSLHELYDDRRILMHRSTAANESTITETSTPRQEEDVLVEAARSGDPTAFEALMVRNKRLILAITRRMTGSMVDGEDVCQQAFMKAFANVSSFGGRSSFSTWLVSIAMNEARMWRRKTLRSREVSMAELCTGECADMLPPDFMDGRPDAEITCSRVEARRLLLAAINRLEPGTRDVVRLCDLEERSTIAAALVLGISTSAVKSRRLRGRLALRERLGSALSSRKRGAGKGAHRQTAEPASQRLVPRARGVQTAPEMPCLAGARQWTDAAHGACEAA
jgi:RNA polymerase sigma-70 factor, ECF subfamily